MAGQPKAAILDRQAKESRNWQADQGHQQSKAAPIGQARIAEHEADGTRAQQSGGLSHVAGKMTSESTLLQPIRQGLGAMKTLSDQKHVPPKECHLPAPRC